MNSREKLILRDGIRVVIAGLCLLIIVFTGEYIIQFFLNYLVVTYNCNGEN